MSEINEYANQMPDADRRSRLVPVREAILTMRKKRYTYRRIQMILQEQADVSVSLSTLYWFVTTSLEAERKAKRRKSQAQSVSIVTEAHSASRVPIPRRSSNATIDALKTRPPTGVCRPGVFQFDESEGLDMLPKRGGKESR